MTDYVPSPELEIQQGTTWRDGKLYFFHPQFIEILRVWPNPLAWRKNAGGGWQHLMSGHFSYDRAVDGAREVQAAIDKAAHDQELPPDPLTVPDIMGNTRLRHQHPGPSRSPPTIGNRPRSPGTCWRRQMR